MRIKKFFALVATLGEGREGMADEREKPLTARGCWSSQGLLLRAGTYPGVFSCISTFSVQLGLKKYEWKCEILQRSSPITVWIDPQEFREHSKFEKQSSTLYLRKKTSRWENLYIPCWLTH